MNSAQKSKIKKIFAEAKAKARSETDPEKQSWIDRLEELYDAAKRRNRGNSLSIYSEVATLIGYLEGTDDVPEGFDLFQECDNLASRLHRA